MNSCISLKERNYLRSLAHQQQDLANTQVMKERQKEWFAHNRGEGERPMIVVEEQTFWGDVKPSLQCTSRTARWLENQLLQNLFVASFIDDDKVIPDTILIPLQIHVQPFGLEFQKTKAKDGIGFHIEPVIRDFPRDLCLLKPSIFNYDKSETERVYDFVLQTVGDILPPRFINRANDWSFCITERVVSLMGMEGMIFSLMDEPYAFNLFMQTITDDMIHYLRWQEENGLLILNNGNDYLGGGSYCFTDELPQDDFDGKVRSCDLWGHLNSQESVILSPDMFHQFIYPHYEKLSSEFGLVYYGCCEPVAPFWDKSISKLKQIRKVSISPWCNEAFMVERLSKSRIIYSRKPSPNYLGVQKEFDEEAFRKDIEKTAKLTSHCHVEYIFRDIYRLHGNIDKLKKAVEIVRLLTS